MSTVGTFEELGQPTGPLATAVGEQVAARPPGSEAVVDLYLSWPGEQHSPEENSARVGELLGALPFASDVRRIAVALTHGGDRPVDYFTSGPSPATTARR